MQKLETAEFFSPFPRCKLWTRSLLLVIRIQILCSGHWIVLKAHEPHQSVADDWIGGIVKFTRNLEVRDGLLLHYQSFLILVNRPLAVEP